MMKPQHIHIAGAGLVGSLLAIFLARRGYQVTLFEKRPDMRRTDISAGRSINLALANRGMAPLEKVGLLDRFRSLILPMRGRMIHDEQGGQMLQPYGQQPHEVIYSVSRGELNKQLMSAAEATGRVQILFQHEIEHIDWQEKSLRLRSTAGQDAGQSRTLGFDLLIGADGAGSVVRKAIDQHYGVASVEAKLFHAYKELHIDGDADGRFRMAADALHIWPRGDYMMIGLPNPDGSFTMTLFMPEQGPHSFAALDSDDKVRDFLQTQFADALPLMPDAIERYRHNPTGLLATVHCPHWQIPGKALLIGDAAHAIVPFHGQGMNCGFEDCADLDRLLDEHSDNWSGVFAAYEALRKPNGEAIARMAEENYVEMRSSVRDPVFLLKKAVGFELEKRHPGRFVPRYSMVMFHHLPYAEALRRGCLQNELLDALCKDCTRVEDIDWSRAEALVEQYCQWPAI